MIEILRPKFDKIIARNDLTRWQKIEQTYNMYLNERIGALPIEIQSKIRSIADNIIPISEDFLTAKYDPYKKRITIYIPESLQDNFLHYAMRVHEIEHAIQDALGRLHITRDLLNPIRYFIEFYVEKEAIIAESIYFLSIPSEHLIEEYGWIQNLTRMDTGYKELAATMLMSAVSSLNIRDYVESQQEASGYSIRGLIFSYWKEVKCIFTGERLQ